jgi:hypothetical protein
MEEFLEIVPAELVHKIGNLKEVFAKIDKQYVEPSKLKSGSIMHLSLEQGMKLLLKNNLN